MKSLQEDIKNQDFKKAYLFCGEEAYLKQQYKHRMKAALLPEDDSMNFSLFEGKKTEPKSVIDLAETMPFFADRRVIMLEDTGFFKSQCTDLPEYMAELPDYLCMIFVEDEVDKRSRMYKAVKKYGRVVEFAKQDSQTLIRWVLNMMKREGTFSDKNRDRYGKHRKGAGKASLLHHGPGCHYCRGHRGCVHHTDHQSYF